jgi:peroxiredoxin
MTTNSQDVEVGSAAPDFSLESNQGISIRLSDYRGHKTVVVYFMREFI